MMVVKDPKQQIVKDIKRRKGGLGTGIMPPAISNYPFTSNQYK
jgi:hypothetical protein